MERTERVRIGLDLDGVVVDSIAYWIRVLNREAGTAYLPGDLPDTYSTATLAACSDRHELEMLIAPPPVAGAVSGLRMMKEFGHTIVAVTARAGRMRGLTEAWLAYHEVPVDRLHFLEGTNKAPVAREERLDLFVEDAPHNALALAEAGVPVLLFAAAYNAGTSHPLVRRCDGWDDVLAQIAMVENAESRARA